VVAAFNGGFQAQHGEYGMQSNGIEYLPPKPYAATVVEFRDGTKRLRRLARAATTVPDDVIGMRQNLTALVQDGKFNPGDAPGGAAHRRDGPTRFTRRAARSVSRARASPATLQHQHFGRGPRTRDARGALLVRHPPRT